MQLQGLVSIKKQPKPLCYKLVSLPLQDITNNTFDYNDEKSFDYWRNRSGWFIPL